MEPTKSGSSVVQVFTSLQVQCLRICYTGARLWEAVVVGWQRHVVGTQQLVLLSLMPSMQERQNALQEPMEIRIYIEAATLSRSIGGTCHSQKHVAK